MEIGEGIEVVEGRGLRVLMPVLPARLGFGKGKWMETVKVVGLVVLCAVLIIIRLLLRDEHRPPVLLIYDAIDGGTLLVFIVVALMLGGIALVVVMCLWKAFFPQRVMILVDRRRVRARLF